MKLLSLWEPWATLMAIGAKRIETRSWSTSYRGWLAIHASKGGLNQEQLSAACADRYFFEALQEYTPYREQIEATVRHKGWIKTVFPHGCIVAVVKLEECDPTELFSTISTAPCFTRITDQEYAFGDYTEGRFGWVTTNLFRLPRPIPFRAAQGLIEVPADVLAQLREQWKERAA